jgi:soluble lytic murein transglycosylase-like protein
MAYENELTYLPIIFKYAVPYGVDAALVLGHMKNESSFNPKAYRYEAKLNDASYGLMQLLLSTAQKYENVTAQQLYDPETNIRIAMKYIRDNLNDWSGNVRDAIAAYNAGDVYINNNGIYTNSQGDTKVEGYVDRVYADYQDYDVWLMNGGASSLQPQAGVTSDIMPVILIGALVYFGYKGMSHVRRH